MRRYNRGTGRLRGPSSHTGGNSDMSTPELSYCEIPLTQGRVAFVDLEDHERINAHKWSARLARTGLWYAVRNSSRTHPMGRHLISMHREVMGVGYGEKVDIDHRERENTLDNRRSNLRLATREENCRNQRLKTRNTSGLKGASFHRATGKWVATIRFGGKQHHLGLFDSAESAHAAYCESADQHHGEFARVA